VFTYRMFTTLSQFSPPFQRKVIPNHLGLFTNVVGREGMNHGVEILRPAPESAGARRASAVEGAELVSPAESTKVPDPEVSDKAVRRRFTAKYKLSVLQRADDCKNPGSTGELLRQVGLYSSHLTEYRK